MTSKIFELKRKQTFLGNNSFIYTLFSKNWIKGFLKLLNLTICSFLCIFQLFRNAGRKVRNHYLALNWHCSSHLDQIGKLPKTTIFNANSNNFPMKGGYAPLYPPPRSLRFTGWSTHHQLISSPPQKCLSCAPGYSPYNLIGRHQRVLYM